MSSINLHFANQLKPHLLETAWRQWGALGASVAVNRPAESMVDPEALVLFSLYLLKDEPRLADVLGSWIRLNSRLLSVQRLRNLRSKYPSEVASALGGLAWVAMHEAKDPRWRSLMSIAPGTPAWAQRDKPRAVEVRFRSATTTVLQLRSGMGVGAKPDIVAFLCGTWNQGQDWASPVMISDAIDYTQAAVRRAIGDLARARFVHELATVDTNRRGKQMYSAPLPSWRVLLELQAGRLEWNYWKELSLMAIAICDWVASLNQRNVSSYAADVEAGRLLESHRRILLRHKLVEADKLSTASLDVVLLESACGKLAMWLDNSA